MNVMDAFAASCRSFDTEDVARQYREQDELIFLRDFVPALELGAMVAESRELVRVAHRSYSPLRRKGGAVGQSAIRRDAPTLDALYRSPAMLAWAERLAGCELTYKDEHDEHAAAIYTYTRPGDHVAWHYDDCGCGGAASYTATLGLVHDTRARAQYKLFGKDGRASRLLSLRMDPGSFLFFCGSKPEHRVTPLHRGEERIVFSFAFVKPGRVPRGKARFLENLKDAFAYFGPKALLQKNY